MKYPKPKGATMKIDLHLHTIYSDGVLTPTEMVKMKKTEQIDAISITDHDSVSGVGEAISEGKKQGIKVISGIELSSYSQFEIHILGYNIDYKNAEFIEKLNAVKELRRDRIDKTIKKLYECGVKLDLSSLDFNNHNLGRAHIAKEMVKQGFSSSVSDAFNKYLGNGKQAHIAGNRLLPFEAVKLIKQFKGLAVLAHPVLIPHNKLESLVVGLKDYGLDGIECYYSSHNETDTKNFLALARNHRLITTCGSDYHDENLYISPSFENDKVDKYSLSKLKLI